MTPIKTVRNMQRHKLARNRPNIPSDKLSNKSQCVSEYFLTSASKSKERKACLEI